MFFAACGAVGEGPDWDENILVYANLNPEGYDREAVDHFNRAHKKKGVQIEVRDYTDGTEYNGKHGKDLLMTEIAAGQMPDIIDLGSIWGGAGQMPYRMLAEKGYLENLWPYIESDPDLGREGILEAPLRAAEVNGGLYMAFEDVVISTLVGSENILGNRYSWSFQELMDVFASMPEESTILEYCTTKSDVFYYMLGMELDSYVDWKTGKCFFDSEYFRRALEFIKVVRRICLYVPALY